MPLHIWITYLKAQKEIIPSDLPQFRDLDKPDQWEEFAALLRERLLILPPPAKEGKGIRLQHTGKIGYIGSPQFRARSYWEIGCINLWVERLSDL